MRQIFTLLLIIKAGELTEAKIVGKPFLSQEFRQSDSVPQGYKPHDEKIHKALFHPFGEALLGLRRLNLHIGLTSNLLDLFQVMTGTTMAMVNLISGNISAFKLDEIALVLSVGPFTGEQVVEIIHHYFPRLEVTASVANRWSGRGRILFQNLLGDLFKKAKGVDDLAELQVLN